VGLSYKNVCESWFWKIEIPSSSEAKGRDVTNHYKYLFSQTERSSPLMKSAILFKMLFALLRGNLSLEDQHKNADTVAYKSFSKLSSCVFSFNLEKIQNTRRIQGNLYLSKGVVK
jgi:hypothetical protein